MTSDNKHFFELLALMTRKELHARYKYTILGFFWLAVNPFIQMIVIGFIFTFIVREPVANYYFFLFLGLLIWNFFSISLLKATPSIVFERDLIKKARFPRSIIPLAIIAANAVHLTIAIFLYAILVSFINPSFWLRLPELLLGFLLLFSFTIGLALLTSALNVRFRDVNFFVQAILIIWFYINPIVYPLKLIPTPYQWLWLFNPLTTVFLLIYHVFLGPDPVNPVLFGVNSLTIVAVVILGVWFFKKENINFDDWV